MSAALAPEPSRAAALRVLQVVAGLHPDHGGTSYSAPRLSQALAAAGADVALYHVEDPNGGAPTPPGVRTAGFAQSWAGAPLLGALRLSRPLRTALRRDAPDADIIHNHGLWLAPNRDAEIAARRADAAFVCSPRGMLSAEALAFSRRRKQVVWALWQRAGLARAACLHATSEAEYDDIRALGLRPPVAIVANGVDVPPQAASQPPAAARTLLSLGRVHPKKNLDTLLEAWARLEAAHPAWRLRIVGPAERNHDAELRAQAQALGLQRVSIEGAIHGAAKLAAYRDAALFVAPTRSENFGLTVAEALASGVPVACSKGAPWAGLETHRCGWWIERDASSLAAGLARAMALPPEELAAMGQRGRAWMVRDFSWERVGRDMLDTYAWLRRGGDRPAFVRVD